MISYNVPAVPTITDPVGIDAFLLPVQEEIVARLPWLAHCFGKCQRLADVDERGAPHYYPAVYTGQIEYWKAFPTDEIGAFAFFDVGKSEKIVQIGPGLGYDATLGAGLVLAFDYRAVYPEDWQTRTIDHVKGQVLEVLRNARTRGGRLTVVGTEEDETGIYPGYDPRPIEARFLMRPFGALRVNLKLEYSTSKFC